MIRKALVIMAVFLLMFSGISLAQNDKLSNQPVNTSSTYNNSVNNSSSSYGSMNGSSGTNDQANSKNQKNILSNDSNTNLESQNPTMFDSISKQNSEIKISDFRGTEANPDKLPVFGYDFFQVTPDTFSPIDNLPVPADYKLGPGDKIQVFVWGGAWEQDFGQNEYVLDVDQNGQITMPFVGVQPARGLTIEQLRKILFAKIKQYKNTEVNVALKQVRTIQVSVTGEAARPGTYTLSGLSTVFNALYTAGGSSNIGSLRQIKLIRNSKTIAAVDVYQYLLAGNRSQDMQLQNGDIIYIPISGKKVAIYGSVKRPAYYELSGNETIKGLIDMAGGVNAYAYLEKVQLQRIEDNKARKIYDLNIIDSLRNANSPQNILLYDGDIIYIPSVLAEQLNQIVLEGSVYRPGTYGAEPGLKIKDLIQRAEGLKGEIYYDRADVFRLTDQKTMELISINLKKALENDPANNIELRDRDQVKIYSPDDVKFLNRKVTVSGAVKNAGIYDRFEKMTVQDLIRIAGGVLPEADTKIELARVNADGVKTDIISLDLRKIYNGDANENLALNDGDKISVFAKNGFLRSPENVTIKGEVQFPGTYSLKDGEKLSDIIKRAGGLTSDAFMQGAIFKRRSDRLGIDNQLKAARQVQKVQEEFEKQVNSDSTSKDSIDNTDLSAIVSSVGTTNKTKTNELAGLSNLSQAVTGLTETIGNNANKTKETREIDPNLDLSRIPVRLSNALESPDSQDNLTLIDGDEIFIPKTPVIVGVKGGVMYQQIIPFAEAEDYEYYIKRSGGYTVDADKNNVVIVRANGEVIPADDVDQIQVGDIIIVPTKPVTAPRDMWTNIGDVVKILSGLAMTWIAIDK